MSAKRVCCDTTSRNFSVNRCDKLGAPKVVLLVKKATETVFASWGMLAPLNEYFALQLFKVLVKSEK